jgi:O-antigen ligase
MLRSMKRPAPLYNLPLDVLKWTALAMVLMLVVTRGTMQEFLREPFQILPGSDPSPRAAGPAISIGLDLLCCVPALLVILRRLLKKTRLHTPVSLKLLAALTAWMMLSPFWAADRFGAIVTAFHWVAATAMLWATVQLVRDWITLRFVAAIAFALIPVYAIHGLNYRFIELPELKKNFEENKEKYLKQRGLEENSFAAKQFIAKINQGEMFGFSTSPNTFGALLSLLLVISAGLLIQRINERDALQWAVPAIALCMLVGLWVMLYTRSRTAFATPFIAAAMLIMARALRPITARLRKPVYWSAVALFFIFTSIVIAYGITHGSLLHSSLTFRWHYWVGGARLFMQHPLLGVGWNNFGPHYLAHRLPIAPEEVKDPHNFLVRCFTELGIVGGLLTVAWQLRLWWETTSPASPSSIPSPERSPRVIGFIAIIGCGGIALSTICGVDLSMGAVELDILRRFLFIAALVIAGSLAALRTLESQDPDARPAPWLLRTLIAGIAAFFIHNLVDFSLFEIGPMLLVSVLIGSVLGVRNPENMAVSSSNNRWPATALATAMILWFAAAGLLWIPVLKSQQASDAADDAIRTNQLATAASLLEEANRDAWKLNADYAFRAAIISPPPQLNRLLAQAIAENPSEGPYYLTRALAEMRQPHPNVAQVRGDFEEALRLDPNNVAVRLDYARALETIGDPKAARRQYEQALRFDDQLSKEEHKRLTPAERIKIEQKLTDLH